MTRLEIVLAAWQEFRVARALSSGVMPEPELTSRFVDVGPHLSSTWPPAWFVREELGFGLDEGPSLQQTCAGLAKKNAAALVTLLKVDAGVDAPDQYTYPLGERR